MPNELDTINFSGNDVADDFDLEADLAKTFAEDVQALGEDETSLVEDTREFASGFPNWDLGPNGIIDL